MLKNFIAWTLGVLCYASIILLVIKISLVPPYSTPEYPGITMICVIVTIFWLIHFHFVIFWKLILNREVRKAFGEVFQLLDYTET